MSKNSETVTQLLAANLGVSVDAFKVPLKNPNNF